jgi:hypothetical protein
MIGEERGMNRGALLPRQVIDELARDEANQIKFSAQARIPARDDRKRPFFRFLCV